MKPFMVVKGGGMDINIIRVPLNDEIFGDFSYINSRIRIEEKLVGAVLVDTVLHEINHAIWAVGQLKSKAQKEERAVSVMASYWTQIFRDNPELIRWINRNLATKTKKK